MQGLFLGGSVQGSPHEAGADWGVGEFTESLSRRHGTGSGVWACDPLGRTANRRSRRARLEGSRGCGVESSARERSRCGLVVVLQTTAVAIAARKRVCQSVWKESWRFGLGRGPRRGSAKSAGSDPPFQALKLRDWPILGFRQTCRFPPVWRVSQAEFRQGPPKVHHNPTLPAAHTPSPTTTPTPIPTRTARLAPPAIPPIRRAQAVLPQNARPDEAHMPPSGPPGTNHRSKIVRLPTFPGPVKPVDQPQIADERGLPNTALPLTGDGVGITLERDDDARLPTCATLERCAVRPALGCCHL